MSFPPNQPSLLPFSPSLLDILQLLEPNDILLCKLVNRSLYNVIESNNHRLPRKGRLLEIKTNMNENGGDIRYIKIYFSIGHYWARRLQEVYISNHLLRIHYLFVPDKEGYTPAVAKYYRRNGVLGGDTTPLPDDEMVKMIKANYFANYRQHYHTEDYRVENVKEALRELIYFIVKNCDIKSLRVDFGSEGGVKFATPDDFVWIVRDILAENRNRVSNIYMNYIPNIEELLLPLGCDTLHVTVNQSNLLDFLGRTANWRREIDVNVDSPGCLPQFLQFLKIWETNGIRINKLKVVCSKPEFRWSHSDMRQAAAARFHASSSNLLRLFGVDYQRMFFRRSIDDVILCLTYCPWESFLNDFEYTGSFGTIPEKYLMEPW